MSCAIVVHRPSLVSVQPISTLPLVLALLELYSLTQENVTSLLVIHYTNVQSVVSFNNALSRKYNSDWASQVSTLEFQCPTYPKVHN